MTSIDWNDRQLCDDGGCTGLIGHDGRCHVCGRAAQFWGDERRRGQVPDVDGEAKTGARAVPAAEGDIAERRLCPDGACTGVIGDDGHCKVCGVLDESAPERAAAAGVAGGGDDDAEDADHGDEDDRADGGDGDDDDDDGDGDNRRLCPDGGCTGLIGDDNRCRVCGRVEEI